MRFYLFSKRRLFWLIGGLLFALSTSAGATRPAVVLGSFAEQRNALALLKKLGLRDDLASVELAISARDTDAHGDSKPLLARVVAYSEDPSQTRALLSQLRAAGFTEAWYLANAPIADTSNARAQTPSASLESPRSQSVRDQAIAGKSEGVRALMSSETQQSLSRRTIGDLSKKEGQPSEPEIENLSNAMGDQEREPSSSDLTKPLSERKAGTEPQKNADEKGRINPNIAASLASQNNSDQQAPQDPGNEQENPTDESRFTSGLTMERNAFAGNAHRWSLDFKATRGSLPSTALKSPYFGDETSSYVADLHLEWRQRFDKVTLSFDHVLQWNAGDVIPWSRSPYGAPELRSLGDSPRALDLTNPVTDGNHHRLHSHFRELMVRWEGQDWNVSLGRDSIHWGTGIVFHPLGLFNPLPPLYVEGDKQFAQDHFLIERLWNSNANPTESLTFLNVSRRTDRDRLFGDVSTTALRLNRKSDRYALGVTAARHYGLSVIGLEASRQIEGVELSSNLVLRERDGNYSNSTWAVVGMVNARLNASTETRTASVFAEYFHNGFGLKALPTSFADLPTDLTYQLARQEAFTFMRDYVALGGDFAWGKEVSQSLRLITNLHDPSLVIKTEFLFTLQQDLRLQLGLITPLSQDGKEFTPLRIGTTSDGVPVTFGPDRRIYLRLKFNR